MPDADNEPSSSAKSASSMGRRGWQTGFLMRCTHSPHPKAIKLSRGASQQVTHAYSCSPRHGWLFCKAQQLSRACGAAHPKHSQLAHTASAGLLRIGQQLRIGKTEVQGSNLWRTGVVAVLEGLLGGRENREGACCLERRLSSLSTCFITFSVSFMRTCATNQSFLGPIQSWTNQYILDCAPPESVSVRPQPMQLNVG